MTDHKFEPFQQVLVRDATDGSKWVAAIFSHIRADCNFPFTTTNGAGFKFCIPYTPETAHLLGTSQPYEPPKPPQEYGWGQKVEVLVEDDWESALYLKYDQYDKERSHGIYAVKSGLDWVSSDRIRPLSDTATHADD